MPENNPYEAPQSDLATEAQTPRPSPAPGWNTSGITVKSLVGLQIAAALLYYFFDIVQALAHSNIRQLQEIVLMFGLLFLALGITLILTGLRRGNYKLVLVELLVLALALWLRLPDIQ